MNEVYTDLEHNNNTKEIPTFSTGAKRDLAGKEDYIETTSWLAMKRYAEYMTSKQSIYGRGNWKKGIPIESYEESLMRHLQKYLANKYDGASFESNEDHLSAAWFNLVGIIHEQEKLKQKIEQELSAREISSQVLKQYPLTEEEATQYRRPNPIPKEVIPLVQQFNGVDYSDLTKVELAKYLGISQRTLYRRLKEQNGAKS